MAKKGKKTPVQERESTSEAISRKFKQSPGIYVGSVVVLILITITFIGGDFLSGGGFGGGGDDWVFGYYDNVPISLIAGNVFAQSYDQLKNSAVAQGRDINDFRLAAQLWRQAYEQAVVHVAVLHIVKKSNYTPSEKTVDRTVAQLPQFQSNGQFSSTLYNQWTEARRFALWRQVQEELAKMMFFRDYENLLIPQNEIDFITDMASSMRSFDMVSFNVEEFPESEYLAFGRENVNLFNTIHLSKITVTSSEREAKRILASIKDGAVAFEDAARVNSQDAYSDRGGDMGSRCLYELDGDIPSASDRDVVFSLRRGELSEVIAVNNGWAIFRIENELANANLEDGIVMEKVRSYVRNVARGRMEDWALAKAQEFTDDANVSGFDNAARWRNLDRRSFGPFPINYSGLELFPQLESFSLPGISEQELAEISRNENFWKIAFSTPLNTPSEPLVQGSRVFVFIPTEQIETDESYLQSIAMMYSSYWVTRIAEQSLPYYFLNNGRMSDDQFFWDAYFRYLMP